MVAPSPLRGPLPGIVLALGAAGALLVAAWLAAPATGTPGAERRSAEPFVPTDTSVVLDRLPGGARESRVLEAARRIRAVGGDARDRANATTPADTSDSTDTARLAVARRHLELARETGDPREAGRAQAVLARWADADAAPVAVRVMRAAVAQHLHAFDDALAELGVAIAQSPDDPQPRWLRAAVLRTLGRLDDAAADCERVDALVRGVSSAASACIEELRSMRGDRDAARRLDARLAERPPPATERAWTDLVRAEIAQREGRDGDAERAFTRAIAAGAGPYARVAFADWLIDRARAADALALLRAAPPTDAVLTVRAIAARRVGDAGAADDVAQLRSRFAASRERAEPDRHLREQARFALDVEGDAQAAVALATRNWTVQKEPADAVLLVRAAQAAARPRAAEPVWAFVETHRITDVRLERR